MRIKYIINQDKHDIIFCPDREGLKIKKKIRSYTTIANDLKRYYNDGKILLIIDRKINKKITRYIIHDLKISFPKISVMMISGTKKNKNFNFLNKIFKTLFEKKFSKKSVIISCGGGVVGDVAGLASSLYLRGLTHFHIPTTMTAIIDSCIGGKTGINYNNIINSIGTYYHAKKVYISKNILYHLPEREYIAGIPEILKCGLINNIKIIKLLENKELVISRKFNYLSEIIKLSLATKIKFFKNDVFERGERLNLNFGHTFAHAIEMAFDKNNRNEVLRHGEAVGLGILCEVYYANKNNRILDLIKKILISYKLPINLKNFISKKKQNNFKKLIFENIFLDKKKIGKFPRYIKLKKIGNAQISELKNFRQIKTTIDKVLF